MDARFPCPCCGHRTLTELGAFEVCPVCLWEDDGEMSTLQPDRWSDGPNGISLAEGRERYRREGRAHGDVPGFVAREVRDGE